MRARAAEGQRPEISIHALLAESDTPAGKVRPWASHISIHALLAESDVLPSYYTSRDYIFLSTLSLRRATGNPARRPIGRRHFYPRSPCGERQLNLINQEKNARNFYPRSPCGERRCYSLRHSTQSRYFYPRSPCGERLLVILFLIHQE